MDYSDYAYDQYLSDWFDENYALATAFGRFLEVFARVGADVDALLIADYGVPEDRLDAFSRDVLGALGFSRRISMMRGSLDRCGVTGGRQLAEDVKEAAEFRNRLVHDVLEWPSAPEHGSSLRYRRAAHGSASDEHVIDAEALEHKVDELVALAGRVRAAFVQVQQKRYPD